MPRAHGIPAGLGSRDLRADGHVAASGAAQFLPFAALRGLDELLEERAADALSEPRHALTEEEALAMSELVAGLRRGEVVRCEAYDGRRYVERRGTVTDIDLVWRELRVDGHRIPLDDLRAIERV